ncbi:transcriptional regulator [Microtetraspora sp. NBRC 13810]|uniref:helix-turn-helix domain-containing protein n=1 Tax=Microtetraspora sp. NBRC 13810 TaxID=3030990 RepID=UPI0024A01625|nr:helix-turn-helix transcriptional regulator [Microtetraspora sp. NBRC 13810]GLW05153.1 transcriptional regulator [Microtetraspora sp. NBRC 13810]
MANQTLGRRQLADRLRRLRLGSGYSIDDVAEKLMCHPSKISRLETGRRAAIPRDVRDLCEIYGVADQRLVSELIELAREARRPGYRHEYDLGDETLYPYNDYEEQAATITDFQTCYLPALLQTEEYARALIRGIYPKMEEKVLESRVALRMRRQQLLTKEGAPRFNALFHESVLHHRIGGPQVMARQLDRIVQTAALPSVSVRIVPFTAGAYMGLANTFVLLELPEMSPARIVYLEGLTKADYLERPNEITIYAEAIRNITENALAPDDSVQLINDLKKAIYS